MKDHIQVLIDLSNMETDIYRLYDEICEAEELKKRDSNGKFRHTAEYKIISRIRSRIGDLVENINYQMDKEEMCTRAS